MIKHFNDFVQLNDLPFKLYKGVALNINNQLYVFGGQNESRNYDNRVYRYSEVADNWDLISAIPINVDSDIPHFSYKDDAYLVDTSGLIYQFNTIDLSWSIATKYPASPGRRGIATVVGNNLYLGVFENRSDVWQWNIPDNRWIQKRGLSGDFRNVNLAVWQHEKNIYLLRNAFGSTTNRNLIIEFKPDDF